MEKALLIGKVIGKVRSGGQWEVALINAPNEISLIHGQDIRAFLYDVDNSSSNQNQSKTKNSNPKRAGRKVAAFDDSELIEEDDFESEDDMQDEDGSESDDSSDEESNDAEDDTDFIRIEPRTKIERKWEVVTDEIKSTNYRGNCPSFVNFVNKNDWQRMSPWDIFELQLPKNELKSWAEYTSKNLRSLRKPPIDETEMKLFVGCLFACTQTRKVGGITKAFETVSDGLFPAQDLGRFGLKLRRFQDIMRCWEFADDSAEGVDIDDDYWRTEKLFDRFNNHYAKLVTHGTYVNVDERIFWAYCRAQPGGVKICGRKPRGTGQECKTLSCIDMCVTTTFEHVRGNKNAEYSRELQKEYGKAASVVLRLCKKAKIDGSNSIVIADSWFANLALYRGLRKNGLHLIGMIKQGDGGFPKQGLCKLLDNDDLPRGSHVVAKTTIDDERVIAVAWKGKSDKSNKGKKKKFWMSTFIASDCTTTLQGEPAEKKRHAPDGTRAPSVFVQRPKLVENYYNGMPGTDIVNRNAQFLIGLEEAARTRDIHKRMCTTVLGTWMANAYGMAMRYWPDEKKKQTSTASFVRGVILEGLFENNRLPLQSINSPNINDNQSLSTLNQQSINGTREDIGHITIPSVHSGSVSSNHATSTNRYASIQQQYPNMPPLQSPVAIGAGSNVAQFAGNTIIDDQTIDPYVHTMHRFRDATSGQCRSQRCVMCIQFGRRTMTTYYCSLCCITANREQDRKASKHAYCINTDNNCFVRHIAKCYMHNNRTGLNAQRSNILHSTDQYIIDESNVLPIAGRIVNHNIPTTRRSTRRSNRR